MCHSVVAQRVCETCGRYMGELVVDFETCARICSSPFYCMTPIPHMEICTMCASTANCPPIRSIHQDVPLDALHPHHIDQNLQPPKDLQDLQQLQQQQQRRASTSTCVSTASSHASSAITYPSSNTSTASSACASSVASIGTAAGCNTTTSTTADMTDMTDSSTRSSSLSSATTADTCDTSITSSSPTSNIILSASHKPDDPLMTARGPASNRRGAVNKASLAGDAGDAAASDSVTAC